MVDEHLTIEADTAARSRVRAVNDCGLTSDQCPVVGLREALDREKLLLREKSDLIRQQEVLNQEADHRLLNSLQIISSMLSMQARSVASAEAASQLAAASKRVAAVGRIHRRLHSLNDAHGVAFKKYLQDICHDLSLMQPSQDLPTGIAVDAIELELPTATAIPLGFIVSELITNAFKYGNGGIAVRLEPASAGRIALSVFNDGPALPNEFDPATSKGLGMRIIRSFVEKIGGELRIGRADAGQGARFTVLFSAGAS